MEEKVPNNHHEDREKDKKYKCEDHEYKLLDLGTGDYSFFICPNCGEERP